MMRLKTIIGLILLLPILVQCRKGCTDEEASNYDSKAKKDDGTCLYTLNPADFDRVPMLANIGDNIILPAYENLHTAITQLQSAVSNFQSQTNQNNLTALRNAWQDALIAWQHAGYFEFGPAEMHLLRANVNIYPVDTAQVNNNIASGSYDLNAASNLDAKGFQSIDYLLYGTGATDMDIITAYTTATDAASRMSYLSDITNDIVQYVSTVRDAWLPSGANYIETFKNNTGLDIGGSSNLLFNAFMMHYEQFVRSGKLGIPAGALSFSQTPLPEKVECYYHGNLSKKMLGEASDALYNLYNGIGTEGDGVGFKDYLDYLETSGPNALLSNDINDQINTSIASINTQLNDPLSDFVVNNQATALTVWNDIQTLVVLLKNDLKSAIGLSITYADADGD